MATTTTRLHHTAFEVGSVLCRFGIVWPDGGNLMTDWARESRVAELPGASGFTETQLLGFGPYKVSYGVFFDSPDDYRALDALVQQTGILTIVRDGHTLPDHGDVPFYLAQNGIAYDRIDGVTLLSLSSSGLWGDASVDGVAVWSRSSS